MLHLTRWNILTILGWLISASAVFPAVESISESFVATAKVMKGNSGSGARLSALSLPMVGPVLTAGTVTGLGSNSVVDVNANWQQGQFNGSNGSYYVEFNSGLMADVANTDAATKSLTLLGDLRSAVATGDSYRLRKHLTVADVFGPHNEAGLLSGANEGKADDILLISPTATVTIFHCSVFNRWSHLDYSDAGQRRLYPEQGLFVRRKASNDVVLFLHGPVKEGPTTVPVYPGYNLVGTLKAFQSLRLADLNLYTGDASTGLAAGANYAAADNLLVINPDGITTLYYYFAGYGWMDCSYRLSDDVLIAPGSAFYIQRRAPRGLFFWTIPPE